MAKAEVKDEKPDGVKWDPVKVEVLANASLNQPQTDTKPSEVKQAPEEAPTLDVRTESNREAEDEFDPNDIAVGREEGPIVPELNSLVVIEDGQKSGSDGGRTEVASGAGKDVNTLEAPQSSEALKAKPDLARMKKLRPCNEETNSTLVIDEDFDTNDIVGASIDVGIESGVNHPIMLDETGDPEGSTGGGDLAVEKGTQMQSNMEANLVCDSSLNVEQPHMGNIIAEVPVKEEEVKVEKPHVQPNTIIDSSRGNLLPEASAIGEMSSIDHNVVASVKEDVKPPKLKVEPSNPEVPDTSIIGNMTGIEVEDNSNALTMEIEQQPAMSPDRLVQMDTDRIPTQEVRPSPSRRKRDRLILDAVEVPTLVSLGWKKRTSVMPSLDLSTLYTIKQEDPSPITIKLEDTEIRITKMDLQRFEDLKNPDIKIKKESLMSDESILARLHAIGLHRFPISLAPDIQACTVHRVWLSQKFGGSSQDTFPSINKKNFTHGLDDFAYLTYEFNPHAPKHPGDPGLFFGGGDGQSTHRVLMRLDTGKWQYMGQYGFFPAAPLTKEEWSSQPLAFKNHWARAIASKLWGQDTRVRVFLRRVLNREPTDEEVRMLWNDPSRSTLSKLMRILRSDVVGVFYMKCVGYDEAFQLELLEMPPNWKPSVKKRKANENGSEGKRQTKKPRQDTGPSMRVRSETPEIDYV
ncbi:hypothetical protein AX16_010076 [Volvariella volvacea WC 439]|nr:hypothetical protein AX16_010076 [Volvariella volvacea WC 439]